MVVEVVLNILAEIIFFILCIYVIPWVGNIIVDKHSDLEHMIEKFEECEDGRKKERLGRLIDIYQALLDVAMVIESWTHALVRRLIEFVILIVTFNHPELTMKIGRGEEEEELNDKFLAKGQLYCEYLYDKASLNWYNPIKMLGHYLADVVHVMFSPIIGVALLWLMLPSTFASVVAGFTQWAYQQGNATGLDFLICLYRGFVDVALNRLTIGGFLENPLLFIIFALIFSVFLSDAYIILDNNGKLSGGNTYCLIMTTLMIIAFNTVFALIAPAAYISVGRYINIFGLATFFIIIVKEIASTAIMCIKSALKIVIDKILPI